MALILEVLAPRTGEVRYRVRLDEVPLTIGRGLGNQLILDDPYVDAEHARLARGDDGTFVLEDLGSVNRLGTTWEGGRERVVLAPGMEVVLGRTTLRFRDEFAPVAPALALQRRTSAHAVVDGTHEAGHAPWYDRTLGRLALVALMMLLAGLNSWLDSSKRSAGTESLTMIIIFATLGATWSGIWSVAARAVTGRFSFLAHLTVFSAASSGALLLTEANRWGEFLLPDRSAVGVLYTGSLLLLLAATIAGHLRYASHLVRPLRWRAGAIASGAVLVTVGVFGLLADDEFSSAAKFPGVIKTVTPALVPTQSVAEFGAVVMDLRAQVDSLLAAPTP